MRQRSLQKGKCFRSGGMGLLQVRQRSDAIPFLPVHVPVPVPVPDARDTAIKARSFFGSVTSSGLFPFRRRRRRSAALHRKARASPRTRSGPRTVSHRHRRRPCFRASRPRSPSVFDAGGDEAPPSRGDKGGDEARPSTRLSIAYSTQAPTERRPPEAPPFRPPHHPSFFFDAFASLAEPPDAPSLFPLASFEPFESLDSFDSLDSFVESPDSAFAFSL
jgi:hypothetical protein